MKKNYLKIKTALSIVMVFSAFALNAQTHITDRAGLEAMAKDTASVNPNSYVLDNDIDLAGAPWETAMNNFFGNLDGNGHKVLNMTITADASLEKIGLFHVIYGTIENLGIVNATINADRQAGVIAGAAVSPALILNCYVENSTITTAGEIVGGFAGLTYGLTVKSSYCDATTITGSAHVGGIIGHMNGGLIEDCHVDVTVIGTNIAAGGIVGWPHEAEGAIKRCYAKGIVKVKFAFVGGIVGVDDNPFKIEIIDCIAAQDSILVNDSIAVVPGGQRIIPNAGDSPNTTVTNCYGLTSIPGTTWGDDAAALDGANMTEAQFIDEVFFGDNLPDWDFGVFGDPVWKMTSVGPLLAWEDDPSTAIRFIKMDSKARVYSSYGKIYIKDAEENARVRFYSVSGALLKEAIIQSTIETYDIKGFLIIEINSPKARGTFKINNL